jgi:hypothetical protein
MNENINSFNKFEKYQIQRLYSSRKVGVEIKFDDIYYINLIKINDEISCLLLQLKNIPKFYHNRYNITQSYRNKPR